MHPYTCKRPSSFESGAVQVLVFRTEDRQKEVQLRLVRDSAWLSLNRIADRFQRDESGVSKHIGFSDPQMM
jgi:hypothetical protein